MSLSASAEMRAPKLESGAARLGVAVLVGLSLVIGWDYWQRQGETQLAYVTVAAEIIAFSGLVLVRYQWRRQFVWALVGLVLTVLAAGWCGLTMYEKIRDDSRADVVAAAQASLSYRLAVSDLEAASYALSGKLGESPPLGSGPQTIGAWEASQAASIARLTAARDDAAARLSAATPPVAVDVFAIARGVGVELIKLLGFAAFGLFGPIRAVAPAIAAPTRPRRPPWWLVLFGVVPASPALADADTAPQVEFIAAASANVIAADAASAAMRQAPRRNHEPAKPRAQRGSPCGKAEIVRAVKAISARGEHPGYRRVAAELGVPASRVERSPHWRANWAKA